MSRAQSRNDPCACGSGLRFKQCCGRIAGAAIAPVPVYGGWEAFTPEERAALWSTMRQALAAQAAGQLDSARELYEQVVGRAPLTFDAVHMLGVVLFQQGELDAAESWLLRALELMPSVEAIQCNLNLLRDRRREQEGLYSVRVICAVDMLRLFGATRRLPAPPAPTEFFTPANSPDADRVHHIVVPGDVLNAASNRNGVALLRHLRFPDHATLWTDPKDAVPMASVADARPIDTASRQIPEGGTLAVFGISPRTMTWLPEAAGTFDSIVIAVDAHDPLTYVDLFDRLPDATLARIRLVARCASMLDDLGLPGAVDPMLFGSRVPEAAGLPSGGRRPRIGVFIPPLREREDALRWEMLEWLRAQGAFLRVLYPGPLPSRHLEDDDEHLVSLVTGWEGWWEGLDGLFYWGGEGRLRQYDRLVFEGLAAGLAIVADGFGDYGSVVAESADGAFFFSLGEAQQAVGAVLPSLRAGSTRRRLAP